MPPPRRGPSAQEKRRQRSNQMSVVVYVVASALFIGILLLSNGACTPQTLPRYAPAMQTVLYVSGGSVTPSYVRGRTRTHMHARQCTRVRTFHTQGWTSLGPGQGARAGKWAQTAHVTTPGLCHPSRGVCVCGGGRVHVSPCAREGLLA